MMQKDSYIDYGGYICGNRQINAVLMGFIRLKRGNCKGNRPVFSVKRCLFDAEPCWQNRGVLTGILTNRIQVQNGIYAPSETVYYGFMYTYPSICLSTNSFIPTGTMLTNGKIRSLWICIPSNALLHATNLTPCCDKSFITS